MRPARLDQLGFVGRGKSKHRPRNDPSLYGGPYPFFQTGDVKNANLYLSEYSQTYNEKGLSQSKLWQPGTLCITIAANIADTAILSVPGCFPDSVVGFIADPEKSDVRYIKYYIDFIKLQMQNVSQGTTQDNMSLEKLLSFDFCVPPVEEQRRIAGILSAYDDLIENCRRRIQILEEMARSLYREWFVHFRYPGHESVPRVPSPLGPIPHSWEVRRLGDVIELVYGKALKQEHRAGGSVAVYGSSGIVGYHDVALAQGPGIVVGRKGNVGSVFWSPTDFFVIDTAYFVNSALPLTFLFEDLQTKNFLNSDAAVPGLSRSQAYSIQTLVPPPDLLETFDKFASPVQSQVAILSKQVASLEQQRNTSLPYLLTSRPQRSSLGSAPNQNAFAEP